MDDDLRAFTALVSPGRASFSDAQVAQLGGLLRQLRRATATGKSDHLVESGSLPLLADIFLGKNGWQRGPLATAQILAGQALANAVASSAAARQSYWEIVMQDITTQSLASLPGRYAWDDLVVGHGCGCRQGSCIEGTANRAHLGTGTHRELHVEMIIAAGAALDVLCYQLFLLGKDCVAREPRLARICDLASTLLNLVPALDHEWDNLVLLLGFVIFDCGMPTELFCGSRPDDPNVALVLGLLCETLAHHLPRDRCGVENPSTRRAMDYFIDTARGCMRCLEGMPAEPEAAQLQLNLHGLLVFGRELLGRDDEGASLSPSGSALGAALLDAGFVDLLLSLLKHARLPDAKKGGSLPLDATISPLSKLKVDVLAGLANALFNRPVVQRQVLASGQLHSILSHCQSDHDAPMAREWALLAVRNICEGNAEAQEEISSLRRMGEPMTTSGLQTK